MSFITWIKISYQSGELFFYIIPAFLFLMLLIVVFIPDKKKTKVETKPETKPEEIEKKEEPVIAEIKPATIEEGLSRTRGGFVSKLKNLFKNSIVDAEMIEELEEVLYTSDMGTETVSWLMDEVNKNKSSFNSGEDVKNFIKEMIRKVLLEAHRDLPVYNDTPAIFLMIGINGAGKTTTIGKLASRFTAEGKQCILAAADTFRAAAVEQLQVWGERTGCTVVSDRDGADPASVAFNAVNSGISKNADFVIIDTAGRLQNRVNLMEELSKISRVINKAKDGTPHETILVIDANNGQNALSQAKQFSEVVNVTGIIVTKLDGTAKGGVLIGIAKELALPVYFVGIGEKVEDLNPFDPNKFSEALFS